MQNLNEVFDSDATYPITNLTPKAKVPQIIHVQAPGTNDIIVRLTSSDTIGTRVKAVKPGDKVVQVFLTSLSEKGNITDFKGGLGSDPIGAINTIFDTVVDICKQNKIEAILFRFPKMKMKGKDQVAQRIIARLTKTRSGGRYTTLDEIEGLSKKFAFSLLYRKGKVLSDIPGIPNIDPEKFEKVESKVGEVYVDKDTGQAVSKADAIAQTIADESIKVTQQTVVSTTKINRNVLISTLYARVAKHLDDYTEEAKIKHNEYISNPLAVKTDNSPDTKLIKSLNDKVTSANTPSNYLNSEGDADKLYDITLDQFNQAAAILAPLIEKANFSNSLDITLKMVEQIKILNLPKVKEHALIRSAQYDIREKFKNALIKTPDIAGQYDKDQINAINSYTDEGYMPINNFLNGLGRNNSINEQTYKYTIPNLDNAFKSGVVLPRDIAVYRGMFLNKDQVENMLKTKYFIFNSFVSTSLAPIIFSGGFGNVTKTLSSPSELSENEDEFIVGFIIKGLNNVKSIITGNMSAHPRECEVILPRGLMIKVKNYYTSDNQLLVDCVIVAQDGTELNESEYGFSFTNLYTEKYYVADDSYAPLVEYLSMSDISPKFIK